MSENIFRGLLTKELKESNITLTTIPYDEGCSCGVGASLAPDKIRELSAYLPPLTMDGILLDKVKLYDFGNVEKCENYFSKLKEVALNRFELNKFPIFIGGDHSVTIPLQEAFYDYCKKENKTPAIIHLDAHPDICYFYDGSKLSHACTNRRSIEYGYKPEDITLIGIRGFEAEEVEYLSSHPELKVYNANKCYNYGIDNIIKDLKNKYSDKYAIYFYADDLKFFKLSGRVSGFSATMGNILGIHPIIHINSEGMMTNVSKSKGKIATLNKILSMVDELQEDIEKYPIVIAHTDAPELAEKLSEMVKEKYGNNLQIDFVIVNPTAGAHCGPNCVGIAFHAKHR